MVNVIAGATYACGACGLVTFVGTETSAVFGERQKVFVFRSLNERHTIRVPATSNASNVVRVPMSKTEASEALAALTAPEGERQRRRPDLPVSDDLALISKLSRAARRRSLTAREHRSLASSMERIIEEVSFVTGRSTNDLRADIQGTPLLAG